MSDYFAAPATAFAGPRRLHSGSLVEAALAAKSAVDGGTQDPVLVFDDRTGAVVEIDLRGSTADLVKWLAERAGEARPAVRLEAAPDRRSSLPLPGEEKSPSRGRGRPRLGVVAREVTLLPRHWEWLDAQPGTASRTLRRLVEAARRDGGRTAERGRLEAAYRFLAAVAGNRPHFEEAVRALFAGDRERFVAVTEGWPADVTEYAIRLAWASATPEPASPAV